MYVPSSCTQLTPQGIAIKDAAVRFGNGQTLPFSPCKRGYIPIVGGERKYACHLHHEQRMKRVKKEGGLFRKGEEDLSRFWIVNHLDDDTGSNDEKTHFTATSIAKKAKVGVESELEKKETNKLSLSRKNHHD